MQQLSALDTIFLSAETRTAPQHIATLSIYDPSTAPGQFVRFKDILRNFKANIDKSPVFTRKIARLPLDIDYPFWVEDPDFDLEFHVRHIALPKPGDWRQLCIQVSRLHSRSLDRSRPLWEAYIIEGLDNVEGVPKGAYAMYLKFHHAVADGMGGLGVFGALHELSPDVSYQQREINEHFASELEEESPIFRRVSRPGLASLMTTSFRNSLRRPSKAFNHVRAVIPEMLKFDSLRDFGVDDSSERGKTPFDAPLTPNRVYSAISRPLSDVKAIRMLCEGSTVNDVACAVVSIAVRNYLLSRGELPELPIKACVPVSMRNKDQAIDAAGNDIETLNLAFPTDLSDPVEVLKEIKASTDAHKSFRQAHPAGALIDFSRQMPALMQGLATRAIALSVRMGGDGALGASLTVTNVPGPPVELYMAGARCVAIHGVGILNEGHGLFNTVSSYNGALSISFLACRKQMPDPGNYQRYLNEAFDALLKQAKKLPKPAKKVAKRSRSVEKLKGDAQLKAKVKASSVERS